MSLGLTLRTAILITTSMVTRDTDYFSPSGRSFDDCPWIFHALLLLSFFDTDADFLIITITALIRKILNISCANKKIHVTVPEKPRFFYFFWILKWTI